VKSRLVVTDAERAQLWDVVAMHRKRQLDYPGAQMAAWTAKSIRSDFPLNKRPSDLRP
jgi:hypothetical protein